MDRHDVAHYGIAGALTAAIGAGAYFMPHPQKTWPVLTNQQAVDIVKNVSAVLGKGQPIGVWCLDRECNKITRQLRAAGKSINVVVNTDRPQAAPDGMTVGAKSLTEATAMQSAVDHFSDHALHADVNVGQDIPYISFGHFVDDEK